GDGNGDAAAADRRQEASRAVRDEDEHCARRRLLQTLKESVRGVGQVKIVGRMDEGYSPAAAVRSHVQESREIADLVHRDEEARLLRALGSRGLIFLSCPLLLFRWRRQLCDRLGLQAPE